MFFYYFYNSLTAPGVMMHELAHAFFCLTAGVKVRRIRLFQFGRVAGYVVHDEPTKFYQGFLVSFGPLIINSIFTLFAASQWQDPGKNWQPWVWAWVGVAAGLHSIPSTEDAHSLLSLANVRIRKNPLVILGYPFILFLYILNLLKRLHIDWVYTIVLFWLGAMYLKS